MPDVVHSMAYTPPPPALNGVPKEDVDGDSMLQPALDVWPAALMSQFVVTMRPRDVEGVEEMVQLGDVCRDIALRGVVWMPGGGERRRGKRKGEEWRMGDGRGMGRAVEVPSIISDECVYQHFNLLYSPIRHPLQIHSTHPSSPLPLSPPNYPIPSNTLIRAEQSLTYLPIKRPIPLGAPRPKARPRATRARRHVRQI